VLYARERVDVGPGFVWGRVSSQSVPVSWGMTQHRGWNPREANPFRQAAEEEVASLLNVVARRNRLSLSSRRR
jgi:hypothetical protein